jgi:hypothetical protein
MSEQKIEIEQSDNLREVDAFALVAAMQPNRVDFIVFNGERTAIRKPNGFEWFNLINRFPSTQALTANLIDRLKSAFLAYKGNIATMTDADIFELLKDVASEIKTENLYDVFLKVGPEAAAAFAAICLGHPGNRTLEDAIKTASNEGLVELFTSCAKITFGGEDIAAFFMQRLTDFEAMGGQRKAQAARENSRLQKLSRKSANRTATVQKQAA